MSHELPTPRLELTDAAYRQIRLIQSHDYTLEGLSFRIKIGGKGCGGFTYLTAFSEARPDDVRVEAIAPAGSLTVLMDRFTAFYAQRMRLDYRLDETTHEEGFVPENLNEKLYAGKFYKDTDLVPPADFL